MGPDYSTMTAAQLEDAIHAINAREAELRDQKRVIHGYLSQRVTEEQAEHAAAQLATMARSTNIDAPTATAEGN